MAGTEYMVLAGSNPLSGPWNESTAAGPLAVVIPSAEEKLWRQLRRVLLIELGDSGAEIMRQDMAQVIVERRDPGHRCRPKKSGHRKYLQSLLVEQCPGTNRCWGVGRGRQRHLNGASGPHASLPAPMSAAPGREFIRICVSTFRSTARP